VVHEADVETGEPVTRLFNHVFSIKVQNYEESYADPVDPWAMDGQSAAVLPAPREPEISLKNRDLAALLYSHSQAVGSDSGGDSRDERDEAVDAVLQTEIWRRNT
jgi:hypothetical protein